MEICLSRVLVVTMVGMMTSQTSAGILEDLELPFTGICAGLASLTSLPTCTDEFVKNMNEYATQFREVNGNKVPDGIPEHVLCCVVNRLQACVVENIGSVCGSDVENVAKSVVKTILKSGKYLANHLSDDQNQITCDWDAWYFRKESPVCWSIYGQLAGTLGLLILLLISCCCCCCKLCCRSKPKAVQIFIPCTTNANGFMNRNTPPYQQLNNASDV